MVRHTYSWSVGVFSWHRMSHKNLTEDGFYRTIKALAEGVIKTEEEGTDV